MTDRPSPDAIDRVAVVGAGTIGASWTTLFLARGLSVDLFDVSDTMESDVRAYIDNAWGSMEQLDYVAPGADPSAVRFHRDPAAAAKDAVFVQESVPERLPIKHDVYRAFEPALAPGAIIATSSSGLLLSDMQDGLADPSRLILAHPFNPPHLIPLVELLGNDRTQPDVIPWAEGFFTRCRKQTIRVNKEVRGHVANRLQAALWREAIHLVAEGVASVADVDKAVAYGPGLRWAVMGPHMLFSLGSGGHGMEGFCERFGGPIEGWWETMGAPQLTPDVIRQLADGVAEEEAGRDFPTLTAERDTKLIALIRALDATGRADQ